MKPFNGPRRPVRQQRGAFGVVFALVLPVLLGLMGLAIDVSVMYARGHELQTFANSTALAAARELDGTQKGLDAALDRAEVLSQKNSYRFLNERMFNWSSSALEIGAGVAGPWYPASAVPTSELPKLFFARVDSAGLDAKYGKLSTSFLQVLGVDASYDISRRAVAGRGLTKLAPLAICALNNAPLSARVNGPGSNNAEALEYGFRNGVSYNLLKLSPYDKTPKNFLINPIDFPPATSRDAHYDDSVVRPLTCTGAMPAPVLTAGSALNVKAPFPPGLIAELNSRFGLYGNGATCEPFGAPPDQNVRDFTGGNGYTAWWMDVGSVAKPIDGSAAELEVGPGLLNVAHAIGAPAQDGGSYGPLWSFGQPRKYNSTTGTVGALFGRSDWKNLYPVKGSATLKSNIYVESKLPYEFNAYPHNQEPPGGNGVAFRRILNVPLLECPFSGSGSATMLGIARFLMTTPATQSPAAIHAEFGGMTTFGPLGASAVLYQ